MIKLNHDSNNAIHLPFFDFFKYLEITIESYKKTLS